MNEDVDVVTIDHDALDRKRQLDRRKRLKITVHITLEPINLFGRNHQLSHPGCVLYFVSLPQRFDRLIDPLLPFMVIRILDGLATAPATDYH